MNTNNEGKVNSDQEFSTELLQVYYSRLFPYDLMFDWLSYGNDPDSQTIGIERDFFSRREWSFTIEDDIYIRYQSFRDKSEMKAAIQKRQPHKIDIGAVFTAPPKDHYTVKPEFFSTKERELVFDIDMTDYDDIRTCCDGAKICSKCWPYMTMAVKVIDRALRDDFSFRNILWIYSGRRGVHCWVCDPGARALTNEARAAVVDYLSVQMGTAENSDQNLKKVFTQPFHPMISRAFSILEPFFAMHIVGENGQGLLARKDRYIKVLNSLPDGSIRTNLYERWEKKEMTGEQRWEEIKTATTQPPSDGMQTAKKRKVDYSVLERWRYELVLTHCYARLDANVSKQQNHLLKSPFCVHPKTGRVCVPIDPKRAETFNPFDVPTVRTLCKEIDEYDIVKMKEGNEEVGDVEKTSLKQSIQLFQKSFMRDMNSVNKKNFREIRDKNAAVNMDF